MVEKKRNVRLLILGLLFLGIFLYLVFAIPPTTSFSLYVLTIPAIVPFHLFLFLSITALFGFAFKNLRRGAFLGTFLVLYLLLRYFHFTQLLFLLLLLAFFLSIEFVFSRNR